MSPPNDVIENLRIFTLNAWGLRYFSQHRKLRIKLIAQHLTEHDYDIVFLQEVWIQSDFEYIRTKTKSLYPFAHMYNNASILGTSGLVILAKWVPKMIHFHPYSINGTPFRPHHGDWFSTKGVAYARIDLKGFTLHLFCTHMHAQYDEEEDIMDQYAIHRVCQSYELAKYINLMACSCSKSSSKDLIILAGDMNTSSKELPYRLLVELTGLIDSYKFDRKKKNFRKNESSLNGNSSSSSSSGSIKNKAHLNRLKDHYCSDESSDEESITCGHKDNTFTKPNPILSKSSKRIDFILYKLRDMCKMNDCCNENNVCETHAHPDTTTSFVSCLPEQLKISAKDVSGLSYSDHQPVAAKLNFLYYTKIYEETLLEGDDGINRNISSDNNKNISSINDSKEVEDDLNFKSLNEVKSKKGCSKFKQQCQQKEFNLKQMTSAYFSAQPSYSKLNNPNLIHDIEDLLRDYIKASTPFKHLLTVAIVLLIVTAFLIVVYFTIDLTTIEMILLSIILLIVTLFGLFLRFVTNRHEVNAVKAVLVDISNKKRFKTEYGLYGNQ